MSGNPDIQDYFDQYDLSQLPVLPSGVSGLLRSLSDETIGYRELSAELELFPSISARLIALANSAWSAPVEPITSLERTCGRLGLQIVRSVSIAIAVSAPFDAGRCPTFDSVRYWSNTLGVADIASLLAVDAMADAEVDLGTVRTAALLHDLGLLFLAHHHPQPMDESFHQYASDDTGSLNAIVKTQVGLSPSQAGAMLASHWNLPMPILTAMAYYDDPEYQGQYADLVAVIGGAIGLVSQLKRNEEFSLDLLANNRLPIDQNKVAKSWEPWRDLLASKHLLAEILFS